MDPHVPDDTVIVDWDAALDQVRLPLSALLFRLSESVPS